MSSPKCKNSRQRTWRSALWSPPISECQLSRSVESAMMLFFTHPTLKFVPSSPLCSNSVLGHGSLGCKKRLRCWKAKKLTIQIFLRSSTFWTTSLVEHHDAVSVFCCSGGAAIPSCSVCSICSCRDSGFVSCGVASSPHTQHLRPEARLVPRKLGIKQQSYQYLFQDFVKPARGITSEVYQFRQKQKTKTLCA